jgi:uncharacterized protein (DUF2062 family)
MTEISTSPNLTKQIESAETIKDQSLADKADISGGKHTSSLETPLTKKSLLFRVRKNIHDYFLMPLILSRNPPWFDARGVSLGFVAGFIMPIGGQLLLIGILRMLLKFNALLAISFSLISNPFTVIPLYRGYYSIGSVFVGKSDHLDMKRFDNMMDATVNQTYAWDSLATFSDLGIDILLRWLIGAVVLAVIFGTTGYIVTYFFQTKRYVEQSNEWEDGAAAFGDEQKSKPDNTPDIQTT